MFKLIVDSGQEQLNGEFGESYSPGLFRYNGQIIFNDAGLDGKERID